MKRRPAFLIPCAFVGLGCPAAAQNATPSPVPTPVAFSAQAHADVTVVTQNATFAGSAALAVAQRAGLIRIDLLSLKSDSFPVPPFTVTVVIDRGANTITAWNDGTKRYRVQAFYPRPAASANPRSSPAASPRPGAHAGTSPFAKLDVLELSVRLTGHTTTAGLATTGLVFDMQVRKKGETATAHVTATTQLADDYLAFPISIDASVAPGATPNSAKVSYAVDQFTPGLPPLTRFTVPAGYTRATSFFDVVLPRRTSPSPAASASPRP